jgi:hypothetical protein
MYILGYTCKLNIFSRARFANHNLLNSHDLFPEQEAPKIAPKRLSGRAFINILACPGAFLVFRESNGAGGRRHFRSPAQDKSPESEVR